MLARIKDIPYFLLLAAILTIFCCQQETPAKKADRTLLNRTISTVSKEFPPAQAVAIGEKSGEMGTLNSSGQKGNFYSSLDPVPNLQRERVLKQIQLPHHYYYREMYLPQVTSGPSAVAWSPDGKTLVYAMQGSLWSQRLGSGIAEQLTGGPGYDHQPDWSPDGRYIVYSSYQHDAMELWLLELETGLSHPLLANGAVQVDPRWSPDGSRLAFVSTLYEQRWHVYIAPFNKGRLGPLERITEDVDSELPRYYYSRYDHYITPVWLPEGRELLLVSNRGRIWGTGGFWKMEARAGAPMQEIHYEETTWKARPDVSPDGKRIVYSSYDGRQWNQLWLMTADGGDVFPITYGEFDTTGPRWSPNGRRIAYISNEDGNSSLLILEVPDGRRTRVKIAERRYRGRVGRLHLSIVDAVNGQPVPARVSVTAPDGRSFTPDNAWRHADDGFVRSQRRYEHCYFHSPGCSEITVPAGPVTVEVMRGLETYVFRQTVEVEPDKTQEVEVSLKRFADLRAKGWVSGDLHVHMNYGGHYRNTPERLAFQAAAEDLHVVENLIVNKEQRMPDIGYFTGRPDSTSNEDRLVMHGQEFHTNVWGHTALLGLTTHVLLPCYAGYVNTAAASLYPDNVAVADFARAQGALIGYVHPFWAEPNPSDRGRALTHELPVSAALDKLDYLEVMGFSDHRSTAAVWYRLLNCGFRLPAGAGTDAMANFASLRGPVGTARVYVNTGGTVDRAAWMDRIRAGRTFVTNAPLLEFTIDGRTPGDEIQLPAGRHSLRARGRLQSIVPIDHFEVFANGEVIVSMSLEGDRTAAEFDFPLTVERSGWYTLRAWNEGAQHPVLDIYPFGTTSPIYVIVGDEPVFSPEDVEYFLAWIDRLEEASHAHQEWNAPAERDAVLGNLAKAKAVYMELRAAIGSR